ncbi:hypothetical protein D3C72_2217420 [compost metagenome]
MAAGHAPLRVATPQLLSSSRVASMPVLRLCTTLPVVKSQRRFNWSVRIVYCWSLKVGVLRASVQVEGSAGFGVSRFAAVTMNAVSM